VGASMFEARGGTLTGGQRLPAARSHARARSRRGSPPAGRQTSAGQRAVGLTVAVTCLLGTGWFVHRVALADTSQLTGTVMNTGELNLNFIGAGQVATVLVRVGEHVSPGQLLATEAGQATSAVVAADRAAVAADRARVRDESAAGAAAGVAAAQAELARDEAQLARDDVSKADTRIVAPTAGVVLAVNAEPGDPASSAGIRDYATGDDSGTSQPLFSLVPQEPEASTQLSAASATLPALELSTTASWRVMVLLPARTAAGITSGEPVTVAIPAARLERLSGSITELVDTPVQTTSGDSYQAVVVITRHGADPPLDGMSANVTLERRAGT
jgi:multidrug efflux pump subunit AcrA (membrane-fusion protein)